MSKISADIYPICICRSGFFIFIDSMERPITLHFKRLQVSIIVKFLKFVTVLSRHRWIGWFSVWFAVTSLI